MIQIPGYRIVRQLGRGGMATVYLAIQESVDREVALKVMSPALLVDPNFGERFLREARIAAKLHHRHVVGVHDVGRHGDLHYIAMEYLSGGPILTKDGHAKDVPFALRATREIAAALGYAHSKGFVHRDVKPDNILLRDDGACALTDFGIARASDSATRMTRTGAVIGTPHYMSPEQARGKPIDGRADLYSLGIVLHELLTGHVPYQADDSLAVGIMHLTEPIPTLPEPLITLQPLLDVMLAKKPEDRYQSGDELAQAIREYELAIAKGELPSLMLPSDEERSKILSSLPAARSASRPTPEPRPTTPPPSAVKRMRAEPTLGRIEDYGGDGMRPHRLQKEAEPGNRGWVKWAVAALVLVGVGAGLWFNQDALRKLLPSSQVGSSLARAEAAFQAGKLSGAPDSAEAQYRAILSVDPDNSQAMAGLKRVGEKLAFDAHDALKKGDVATARTLAAQARGLLQGGKEIEELEAALKQTEVKENPITEVLDQAALALKDGKLLGNDQSAAALYQKALAIEPGNAVARKGMGDVINALAVQVKELLGQRKLDEAAQRIADIERLDRSAVVLAEVKALLADARVADSRQVDEVLGRAEALLKKGQIAAPPGNNALELYREALKRDPQNAKVKAGLRQIAGSLLVAANAAIEAKDLPAAERAIAQAESAGAPAGELAAARTRLRELREQGAIAAQVVTLTPEKQAQLDKYLVEADAALQRGDLIDPPGGNAYDMYRGALGLDRNNARAKAGIAAIPEKAKALFEGQVASGKLNKAYAYIDAIQAVAPSDSSAGGLKIKLAQAYVKQADQQIGANQFDAAGRSIARAKELAPDDPSIAAADEKLRAAKGG